ncbi:MAG: tRNA uridine-5-carboxymethylaminomethyl(34) synthesis GTPase MnmE [Alphaproteobacteria bacterium]|nr:tRNA uridine-5-carboxymethylaminomethyl(34) synthesis GTPase MnmE [Alphaproteobacteria bacterium]
MTDTIFALSSGHGKAGVAVVRVSGAAVPLLWRGGPKGRGGLANCEHYTNHPVSLISFASHPSTGGEPLPRHAYLADLVDKSSDVIDRAIAIYFQAPHSFTGEDIIEFHVHGAAAVIEKLFATLRAYGARLANPGEFARRAFDNGKMDLIEADGLAALLDSRTDAQRRSALRAAAGADSAVYENWRLQMVEITAYSAAMLDYPAEELPANIGETILSRTRALGKEISAALSRSAAARSIRSGFNIAIIGPVNAGKSSLFNRLVGESRAIVSEIPGTTRDVVSAEIDIDGYLVRLADTAGLRETQDTIEKIGIEKTNQEIERADLVIRVETRNAKRETRDNEIIVINKCDLLDNNNRVSRFAFRVSALTGEGIPELLERIRAEVHSRLDGAQSDVALNERARMHLQAAADELAKAEGQKTNMDLFSEHIRRAADNIGQILGVIGASEVADSVFGQLCLGK